MSTDNNRSYHYCPDDYSWLRKKAVIVNLTVSDGNLTDTKEWNIVLEPLVDPKVALSIIVLFFIGIALFFAAPHTTSWLSRKFSISYEASDNISKGVMFFVLAISPLFYAYFNFPGGIIALFFALIFFNESGKRLLPGSFVKIKKRLAKLRTKETEVKGETKEDAKGKELWYSPGIIILSLIYFLFRFGDLQYFHMIFFMFIFGLLEYAKEKCLGVVITPTEGKTEKQRRERNTNTDPNGIIPKMKQKISYLLKEITLSILRRMHEIDFKASGLIFFILLLHYWGLFEFLYDQNTLYWFYSTIAQAFAAILGIIIAMCGVMMWLSQEKAETLRNFVLGFKGFTIIFILIIIISLVGLMTMLCPNFTALEEHGFGLSTVWNNKDAIQNLFGILVFEITLLLIPAALIYFYALIAAFLDVYSKGLKEEKKEDDSMGYA